MNITSINWGQVAIIAFIVVLLVSGIIVYSCAVVSGRCNDAERRAFREAFGTGGDDE